MCNVQFAMCSEFNLLITMLASDFLARIGESSSAVTHHSSSSPRGAVALGGLRGLPTYMEYETGVSSHAPREPNLLGVDPTYLPTWTPLYVHMNS